MKKIVMIGPVYPYKGGIAHYTGLMCKNLRKKYDVRMISYKMQYPKLLFRKPQRDYENDAFEIGDTEFLIHTANPFNWRKVVKYINAMRADLVIIQWWHPYFSLCYRSIAKYLKDTKVLFLCHNVFPHERFPMDKRLTKSVLKCGNYFIVHSQQDAEDLLAIKPEASYQKTVLPTYNVFKFTDMSKQEARRQLGISDKEYVLLFFGLVREYKGLKYLIQAMPEIFAAYSNIKLLVVGDFAGKKEEYMDIISKTGAKQTICIYDGYIPDREVEKFFACCDLVVLPYISATQSAVVQMAYGFDKPVVVTNVGGLPEVVANGKTGYVVPPENPQALADAVIRFFKEGKALEFEAGVKQESYRYDWDRMTETVESLFEGECN